MRFPIPGGIIVSGSIVHDTVARPVDEVRWDTTQWLERVETHMGGNGASTAYTIGKLGVPVRLLGAVGRDGFGDELLSRLRGAGVDVAGVERVDKPTAATVVLVNAAGARALLHRPGASEGLFGEPLCFDGAAAQGFRHYHLGNVFALPAMRPHAAATLRNARTAGLTTSVDTGWDTQDEWMRMLGPCLGDTGILFASREEAEKLSGRSTPEEAGRFLRSQGAEVIVVKLGAGGCLLIAEAFERRISGFPVEAVDTTGAGDCFAGGLLAAVSRGQSLEDACQFANAVGACSVTRMGATDGVLGYEETLEWMERRLKSAADRA